MILMILFISSIYQPASCQLEGVEFKNFKFTPSYTPTLPDDQQLMTEFQTIVEAQDDLSVSDIQSVNYWNASYPSYRWHQIMMDVSRSHKGYKNGGRVAILHLAIYDALVAVRTIKQDHKQSPPYRRNSRIEQIGRERPYSSKVCEWSAAAGAAHSIIGYYFPYRMSYLDSLLANFKESRLRTGLVYPSDIEIGIDLGKEIAEKYIEYAKTDRTDVAWEGTVPTSDDLWSGDPGPWTPARAQWVPLTLDSATQFRPGPPPTDWTADMEELREFNKNHDHSDIAWKWKSAPVFDDMLERKILEYDLDPFEAAYTCALFHTARFDAMIAAFEAKYHYWGIRPFQYDPEFKPLLVQTPNFPGYPAGHTTVAGSLATALAYLFPQDAESFYDMAWECSESRFEGGVHFRTDNEVGLKVGEKVGNKVISAFGG